MEPVSRRTVLAGSLVSASVASAGPADGAPRTGFATHAWGSIANALYRGERLRTALFFAGPPNPSSLPLYTRHPLDAARLDWSSERDVRFALRQCRAAGLNTIKLSYWGHEGETDRWSPALLFSQNRWPGDGDGTYTEAEQVGQARRFFRIAAEEDLLVAPMLEVSPSFPFYSQFPTDLDELVRRSTWLLSQFGGEPNLLSLRDREGRARPVLWLIETVHASAVDPDEFAQGFDRAAGLVKATTGRLPGFVIDPTPLGGYGSNAGPSPEPLRRTTSVLAVNPFNITSQGPGERKPQSEITEAERLQYAEQVMRTWSGSGIPFVAPVIPGYDAHVVFPDSGIYGFNQAWRSQQIDLALRYQTAGVSVDCWNGWTEAYAIPPSVESGDTELRWVQKVMRHI